MTKLKEKKEFKREYIPVIVTGIILILLIGALIFTIFYDKKLDLEEVPVDYGHRVNELNVDVDRNKCSTDVIKKLTDEAKKVTLEYKEDSRENKIERLEGPTIDVEYFWLVTLKNMTDNFYVKVTNDKTDKVVIINKDNLVDGKYQFETYRSNMVITYTISLISNNADCNEQVIRELELKVPAYNIFSTQWTCSFYPNFELCKKWVNKDNVAKIFYDELQEYKDKNPGIEEKEAILESSIVFDNEAFQKDIEKANKKSKNIKIITICVIAIAIIGVGVVMVILLKKRGRK